MSPERSRAAGAQTQVPAVSAPVFSRPGLSAAPRPGHVTAGMRSAARIAVTHFAVRRAALIVFAMSMAMVMGPTPPGTGVMCEQRGETLGKSTSPVRR